MILEGSLGTPVGKKTSFLQWHVSCDAEITDFLFTYMLYHSGSQPGGFVPQSFQGVRKAYKT